jgi:hypothetical protein
MLTLAEAVRDQPYGGGRTLHAKSVEYRGEEAP